MTYGVFLWLPKILRDASGFDGFKLSAITAIPFTAALIGMVLIGRHSDRTGERKVHVALCALTAAIGLMLAVTFQDSVLIIVLSFALSQVGQRSVMSVFWAIPPIFLGGTRRGRRHRPDQLDRQSRRLRRPHRDGHACAAARKAIRAGCWCSPRR